MRHAYSRRTKDKPGLCGTVTVKFAIDESGKVTNARITSSSMPDSILEAAVVSWVRSYVFESIDKPGDVTEVTYPFTFTNDYCNPNITSQATAADIERWKRDEERWKKAQNAAAERKERWRREDERWRIETDRRMAEEARRRKKAEYERLKKLAEFAAPPYIQALTGNADADYQLYLMLRDNNANSPKFYFDMAGWFHDLGDTETALRILTSIAELEIESAPLYRMLGYRLKEYGEYTLQKFVCGKVLEWRPLEPQSYRDYALALADNGEHQAALDSLYGLLIRDYSAHIGRGSSGIEEVVITEINRLITQNPRLSMSKIDRRLRMEMPLDVRVALNWNHNNTNIDLIVEDPLGNISIFNNSRSNYSSGAVPTGGRMSADNSRGYGPEQFMLKKAVKGKYSIYAAYRSAREFAADGPVTVMAEVYTKYGTKDEQRAVVTMQLAREHFAWNNWGRWTAQSSEKILIGEFEL
ncbi:MAG: TonB family protein [Chitinispirillia bacterium]|nr:TonB family protein [Chitinispirillia bacterium]MCL2241824.1 TonB family protein [Chitinispirillia bacterium]